MGERAVFERQGWPTLPPGWDELVGASPDIDRFCSGADWSLTAHASFGRRGRLHTASGDGAAVALACARTPWRTPVLCSLDPVWGFACPVVGPDAAEAAGLVADLLRRPDGRWAATLLSGVAPGSAREAALADRLGRRHRIEVGPSMTRRLADLEGGAQTWLERRGPHFRRNLRRARRRAADAGLRIEPVVGGAEVVERAVAVDRRSWKGTQGSGLAEPAMASFYAGLARRLAPAGGLRAAFARQGGTDVGFILGAVRDDTYRGFQLAHDEHVAALSVGNLLQWHQIEAAATEGIVRYDLGMDMEYKRAWADLELTTRTLVVLG